MTLAEELRKAANYESLVTPTRPEIQVLMHRAADALESRGQRIRELAPYVQHNDKCRSLDYEEPCDCGLASVLEGQK